MAKSFSWSSLTGISLHQSSVETSATVSRSTVLETNPCDNSGTHGLKSSSAKPSYRLSRRRKLHQLYSREVAPWLQRVSRIFIELCSKIVQTKPTPTQVALMLLLQLIICTEYRISHRLEWEIDLEWTTWEKNVQNAIRQSIPPRLDRILTNKFPISDHLKLFPNLQKSNVSEFVVPMPDYEEMAAVRKKLVTSLRSDASSTCQLMRQQNETNLHYTQSQQTKHLLPVMGVTVANDTPENRYLRRILHTVDFATVGSIVITWYDEHTEAQLLEDKPGLSHEVIEEALDEFIGRFHFSEIDWRNDRASGSELRLASSVSLRHLSRITTSIHQYCRFEGGPNTKRPQHSILDCQNELVILRFPTNLGCSVGVNNPLFTHPTVPYWLIANYDIAYPPGVLANIGQSVKNTLQYMPELAVHTFGYIYGRGQLENPWSNFIMTSCAVANVGVWDEDIYPAYYEDDDFRDRIRYILGRWVDDYGSLEQGYEDIPTKRMDDSHLIRYQTDRSVAVAHGPLSAETYISGTHDTMQKVEDEEQEAFHIGQCFLHLFRRSQNSAPPVSRNPFHYESLRWKTVRELTDTESFFQCKHGNLPDPGEFGEDTLRYFGWNERFLVPFINETRVDRLAKALERNGYAASIGHVDLPLWSRWSFNATRRKCAHDGANRLLSFPYSEDAYELEVRKNLTLELQMLCSVC